MKKIVMTIILTLNVMSAQAQEFVIEVAPAPNSIGNNEVSSISSSKISDFVSSVISSMSSTLNSYLKKEDIIQPTITRITAVGLSTYTTPEGALYLKVKMVGGGAGGGGSGAPNGPNPSHGGSSFFGPSSSPILVAEGGLGGGPSGSQPIGIINSPAYGFFIRGQNGEGYFYNGTSGINVFGGAGGSSAFGPGASRGHGSSSNYNGTSALANTGGGGSGGGGGSLSGKYGGVGGGGAAYVEAIIPNPESSYQITVGAGSSGGAAGTSGNPGGAGGSGIIIIEAHYQ